MTFLFIVVVVLDVSGAARVYWWINMGY